jgi:hypothetical protein
MMELLVSMVLLTIVLTGLIAMQVASIRGVTEAGRSADALRLAELVMARYEEKACQFGKLPAPTVDGAGKATWGSEYKKPGNQSSTNNMPMTNVAANGEDEGPFVVQRLVEIPVDAVTNIPDNSRRVVTIRVCWLPARATAQQMAVADVCTVRQTSLTIQRSQ